MCPGISANSETASALVNAVSAADRADAVKLRLRLRAGEPVRGNRDSHEQQPDQRPSHASTRHEEVWMLSGTTSVILAAALTRACRRRVRAAETHRLPRPRFGGPEYPAAGYVPDRRALSRIRARSATMGNRSLPAEGVRDGADRARVRAGAGRGDRHRHLAAGPRSGHRLVAPRHPRQKADDIGAELDELREQVLLARRDGDTGTERALEGAWQVRLQQLLRADPALAAELRRVLDQVLTPALTPAEQARVGTIIMTGSSHDSSTFTQIGTQTNYTGHDHRPAGAHRRTLRRSRVEMRGESRESPISAKPWRSTGASDPPPRHGRPRPT